MFSGGDSSSLTYRWVMKMAGESNLSRPYAQHPWVHACISAIAKAVSSAPLVIQKPTPGGEMEPVNDGPLYDLFAMPNKLMSQRKFLKSLTQTQQLYGETMLLMMQRDANGVINYIAPEERIDVPSELWPVRGDLLEEVIDERTQLPCAWRMQTAQGTVEVPAESLVHIAEANPYSPIRGMGPMQAAYRTAAKDFVLDRYDEALLQNSGSPGGILSVDGHLTDADQRAISDAWREAHGRPDSHRKTAVLPNGTKYEEIGFSPQEMEFQQMRFLNRETIMSIFGVTKPIIGLTEGLNYASSMLAFRSFYEVTVVPFLDFLADELQTKFIRRLKGPESECQIKFDLSGVAAMREDADSKVDRTLRLFKEGGRTFNEAAALAGWDIGDSELDNGDIAFVSSSLNQLKVDADGNLDTPAGPPIASPPPANEVGGGEGEAIEEDEDFQDEGRDYTKIDQEEIDEVFKQWRASVNMSASELVSWSENPCSREASVNPSAVISRNLRLLETKKADWDGTHVRAANRAISFIARMRGSEQGEPASEGCPSKRDISLKNWAYNPDKASRSVDTQQREMRFPPDLQTAAARLKYWEAWDAEVTRAEDKVARTSKRVLRELVLSIRLRLREAAEGPWQDTPAPKGKAVRKMVATEAEIQRLLDLNLAAWGDEMFAALSPNIVEVMLDSAAQANAEAAGGATILTSTDPVVALYMAEKKVVLTNITTNLIDEVQRAIVRVLAGDSGQYSSLREAIWATLADSEDYLGKTLKGLGTRASLIARTETAGAANYGRQQQMVADGINTNIWLAQPTARPHHAELNGKEVNIGEVFGYGLKFPGDPNAKVGEIANCRCVLLPGTQRDYS